MLVFFAVQLFLISQEGGKNQVKTTREQFEIFCQECEKWIYRFGLYGWRFYFSHTHKLNGVIAWIEYPINIEDCVFTVGLEPKLNYDYTEIDIRRSAFHEIMHAFLYRLNLFAKERVAFSSDIDEEEHHIIRILERVVWETENTIMKKGD